MTRPLKTTAAAPQPARSSAATRATTPGSGGALADPRWHDIVATMAALRERHRCAIRIVDADCGNGALLIEAVRHARSLGFTAIEGRGVDGSPALIARARTRASEVGDRAIGLTFDLADMAEALAQEAVFPADIVLWHGTRREDHRPGIVAMLSHAADVVIGDPAAMPVRGRAA